MLKKLCQKKHKKTPSHKGQGHDKGSGQVKGLERHIGQGVCNQGVLSRWVG